MKHPFPRLQFSSTDALQDIESLTTATREIYDWIMIKVVGNDVLPRRCPSEIDDSIEKIQRYSENLKSKILNLQSAETEIHSEIVRKVLQKEMLTETEYYYCRILDLIDGISERNSEYRKYQLTFESIKRDSEVSPNETDS